MVNIAYGNNFTNTNSATAIGIIVKTEASGTVVINAPNTRIFVFGVIGLWNFVIRQVFH